MGKFWKQYYAVINLTDFLQHDLADQRRLQGTSSLGVSGFCLQFCVCENNIQDINIHGHVESSLVTFSLKT
jgi:hypothetical protein